MASLPILRKSHLESVDKLVSDLTEGIVYLHEIFPLENPFILQYLTNANTYNSKFSVVVPDLRNHITHTKQIDAIPFTVYDMLRFAAADEHLFINGMLVGSELPRVQDMHVAKTLIEVKNADQNYIKKSSDMLKKENPLVLEMIDEVSKVISKIRQGRDAKADGAVFTSLVMYAAVRSALPCYELKAS